MYSLRYGIWNHDGKRMVISFLFITDIGTHCCNSLRWALLGKVVSNEKLASNACVKKEEHDS